MYSYSKFTFDRTTSDFFYDEPLSKDYRVFLNGTEIPVYTCRISRYPFNRVWPDHQRSIDQTVPASFVNIVSDEEITLEVEIGREHKRTVLKPYSKGIALTREENRVSFTLKENGQYVLELDDHHHCLYIFNSRPIARPEPSEVTHYFGPGIHMVGKIVLHDNESIYVDKDALVFGCIFAKNAKNIHIFGNGMFDDSGEERFAGHCYSDFTTGNVKFYDCENIKVEGVLFKNSAMWCFNLFHCFHAVLDDIKIFGQWRYNTDGIDIVNSQDITVRNSFVQVFDDVITIKGIDLYAATSVKDILAENCVLWCDWGRTCEIGLETTCQTYQNITFRNCDVLRGGNTVLDIQNGDCAEVSNILYEDIRVEFNVCDTPEQLQETDDSVYTGENEIAVPNLICIVNFRYREMPDLETIGVNPDGVQLGNVHDVTYRNIEVYYEDGIPMADGKYNIPIAIKSVRKDSVFSNINIENIKVNGVELKLDEMTTDRAVLANVCYIEE